MASESLRSRRNIQEQVSHIKQFHDEAYLYTQQAICCEEAGSFAESVTLYERSLQLIEQGLGIMVENGEPEELEISNTMQGKMRNTKIHIMERLQSIKKDQKIFEASEKIKRSEQPEKRNPMDSPPSYEEIYGKQQAYSPSANLYPVEMLTSASNAELTASCLTGLTTIPREATEIYSISNGVQIFCVLPNGFVTAPSYPSKLSIYRFIEDENVNEKENNAGREHPPAFLQVGDWVYPLVQGQTPVLHSSYGAYMFPDVNSDQPGAVVGVLIPSEVDATSREILEHLLCELTALVDQCPPAYTPSPYVVSPVSVDEPQQEEEEGEPERNMSEKISDGIVKGAELLSQGLVYGAEKTSYLVGVGAAKLRERMENSQNPVIVDPRVQQGVKIAKDVTGVAVTVSTYLVTQLGRATMAAGRYIAPHLRDQGTKLISRTFHTQPGNAENTVDGVLEVASGGLRGFGTVYLGLEKAALILANNLANETVQVVQLRYGSQVGEVTENALYAVGYTAVASYNVGTLGPKSIAKRAAKDTGRAMVEDYVKGKEAPSTSKTTNNSEKGDQCIQCSEEKYNDKSKMG